MAGGWGSFSPVHHLGNELCLRRFSFSTIPDSNAKRGGEVGGDVCWERTCRAPQNRAGYFSLSNTATWLTLSEVNGLRSQLAHLF